MVRGFETTHLLSSQMLTPATGAAHHRVCSKCNALFAVERRPKTPGVCIELAFGNPRCCSVQLALDAACFHFCRYWWMFLSHYLSVGESCHGCCRSPTLKAHHISTPHSLRSHNTTRYPRSTYRPSHRLRPTSWSTHSVSESRGSSEFDRGV